MAVNLRRMEIYEDGMNGMNECCVEGRKEGFR